jgi:hypothetical protein
MIGQAIRYLLIGYGNKTTNSHLDPQSEVYDIVGDNVFPNVLPQNYGTPSIVYTVRDIEPSNIKSFRALANTIDIEIDIVSESYADVVKLSTLIINNLHRYNNIYNSNDDTSIGYGTPLYTTAFASGNYGDHSPACTGPIQYVAGIQIIDLFFINSTETFDDILENYRNTLTFKLTYINDIANWGADFYLKLDDLNLMATNSSGGNPLYDQPININDGVQYIWSPCVYSESDNVQFITEVLSVNNEYPVFVSKNSPSTTYTPTLKRSAITPPKFNGLNYLEFGSSKYLVPVSQALASNRRYKELTFFCVFTLPDSYSNAKGASFLFKDSAGSATEYGGIGVKSEILGSEHFFHLFLTALEDNGSGGDAESSEVLLTLQSNTGLNPDLRFSEPVYFAFSVSRTSTTKLAGETDIVTASYRAKNWAGTGDRFNRFEHPSSTTWQEYFLKFGSIHSDLTSYDTNGEGTINLNDELHIYDLVVVPDKLDFGSAEYSQIKNSILQKHRLANTYKL